MTSRDLLALLIRRWYLVLVGAVLSAGAVLLLTAPQPLYWTQFNVVLLPPTPTRELPNKLENGPYRLAQMAGVIMKDVGLDPPMVLASSDTTIYGQGTRSGAQVTSPNQGTQWKALYFSHNLDVQVVGPTPEVVSARADQIVEDVQQALEARQDALGVRRNMRITAIAASEDPVVYPVTGSRPRAAAATALVGAGSTVGLVYWLERWRGRRRDRAGKGEQGC